MPKNLSYAVIMGTLLVSASWLPAHANDQRDSVTSSGNVVVSSSGACVRTKWSANDDVCAPTPPPPAPQPAPPPPPQVSLEQRTIYFEFNKDRLTGEAITKLDTLVSVITGSDRIVKATVVGYADDIGSSDYNYKLSQKRASAVEQYLDSRVNIPTSSRTVRGAGESQPVTSCDTRMGRNERISCLARDRRVEVELTYQK